MFVVRWIEEGQIVLLTRTQDASPEFWRIII